MPDTLTRYRIFIASPGGLEAERQAFHAAILEYNKKDANYRGVEFEPVGWEDTLGGRRRPQRTINEELKTCDYFVMILWDRWGSPPGPAEDGTTYSSGTEEEYHLARHCCDDDKAPMQDMFLFFKGVNEEDLANPDEQLQQVLNFKKDLEAKKEIFYNTFDALGHFEKILDRALAKWVRDHERGTVAGQNLPPLDLPKDKLVPTEHGAETLLQVQPDGLVGEAWQAANGGKLVEAEALFAQASVGGASPWPFLDYARFLARVGRLDQAVVMIKQAMTLAQQHNDNVAWAESHNRLGIVCKTRGELAEAEAMYRKALGINEQLGRLEGMASDYGNLGNVYQIRGELAEAEAMHRKALDVFEQLNDLQGVVSVYSNLGIVYRIQDNLTEAEAMHRKALDVFKQLGRLEGMASAYGSLGHVYEIRGDLTKAESLHRKALEIHKQLNDLQGMANDYGNLGIVYRIQDNLTEAEAMYHKALEIHKQLNDLQGISNDYGNLGIVYRILGELVEAEAMHLKALGINEQLGRLEGMASDYGNLGNVYQIRGELAEAERLWRKALGYAQQLGARPLIAQLEGWLKSLRF